MELAADKRLLQEDVSALTAPNGLSGTHLKTPEELANIVSRFTFELWRVVHNAFRILTIKHLGEVTVLRLWRLFIGTLRISGS